MIETIVREAETLNLDCGGGGSFWQGNMPRGRGGCKKDAVVADALQTWMDDARLDDGQVGDEVMMIV